MLGERHSRVRLSPGLDTLRDDKVSDSMLRVVLKWIALFYLIVESLGLVASCLKLLLRLTQSNPSLPRSPLGDLSLDIAIHFVIVGSILSAYLFLRKLSQLPLIVTRQSALLTARAAQSGFLATIGLCALASEKLTAIVEPTPLFAAWTIAASAVGTVGVTLFLRRRFLSEANDQLRRDSTDARALGEWRKFTILSLVLAMSIGLDGFALRMTGYRRTVEWSFFACAMVLLFFWRPRLSEGTSAKSW
jgi:hypothetical protein